MDCINGLSFSLPFDLGLVKRWYQQEVGEEEKREIEMSIPDSLPEMVWI